MVGWMARRPVEMTEVFRPGQQLVRKTAELSDDCWVETMDDISVGSKVRGKVRW